MIEKMAELVRDKRIEGISDIRDESDRQGYRVVIELKRDAVADVILNQLYRFTPLQTSFGVNMVALNGGKPELMTLIDMLQAFVAFREEVVSRRTKFLLRKARDRAHVLVGLAIAVANIDEVIRLIRSAPDPQTAREQLMERRWPADDVEAADPADRRSAPPDQRGRHLQSLRRAGARHPRPAPAAPDGARPRRDRRRTRQDRRGDQRLSRHPALARAHPWRIIKDELAAVRDEFGTPRRTEIVDGGADMEDEDLIPREDMVVTVTHDGYIKRVPLSIYRAQRRGGKGRSGMATKDEDFVTRLFVANTHTPILFFSSRGIVYKEKVWRLPIGDAAVARQVPDQHAAAARRASASPRSCRCRRTRTRWDKLDVMFATTRGTVRRNKLSRLRAGQPQRQDRHEARRGGRRDPRRRDLHRERRRAADGRDRPVHPLPGDRCARVQGPRIRRACAASRWPRATASSR